MSFKTKKSEPMANEDNISPFETIKSHKMPIKWQSIRPDALKVIFFKVFGFFRQNPQKRLKNKKPIIYPPESPKSELNPPLNCEKTGIPTAPVKIYAITDSIDHLAPKKYPQKATAKVCRVIGTPKGDCIEICESRAIMAVKRAERIILCICFLGFIYFLILRVVKKFKILTTLKLNIVFNYAKPSATPIKIIPAKTVKTTA